MPNNTFEDYKKAVKKKYEIEKNGDHSLYLSNPTRGRLRNLCWELFQQQNRNQDDLTVFSSLLGLAFDVNKRNKFDEQIDKFRPIDNFFKGESDPAIVDVVNMAAILVDFKARPFIKFRMQALFEEEGPIEEEGPTEDEGPIEEGEKIEVLNPEKEQSTHSGILDIFLVRKEIEKVNGIKEINGIEVIKPEVNTIVNVEVEKNPDPDPNPGSNFKFPTKMHFTIMGIIGLLCLISVSTYYAFQDKECMQWSGDHYEMVDCDLKIQGFAKSSNIEIIDPTLVHLKKIKVCDTTTYFDKNGVAIVWYAKTANGIDFFDAHGRHPENNSPLRPVTHYILNKYVKR
ncbi:hypothetical protein Flavo103_02410 [Flavobacterium collinsii]|uniref:hypothetical protein n=1 Tax=Flavobacterium collinsii TaxID=1114861 RepID=UPI0022BCE278|nr:hypothetical protein [Flavobacterium collinsii]GIQ57105.1 hypothetical protein Flavo103_02410 [Flavobacterium collinsii]